MIRRRAATRVLAGLTAAVALLLAGCGTGGGAAAPGRTIGVSVADQKSLFYVAAVEGMRAEAAKRGYELVVTSANNNSTQQVSQVNDLLTQQVGALIFISQDSTAAGAGVRAANQADVPVVAVDQRPETGDGELATYIATDSVKASRELCSWMFRQMGGRGELAILRGVLGSTAEIQRSQGCQEALKANPGVRVVAEESANWDQTEAFKATQNILSANPNLKAVFGESDAMALGAAKAAQQAGRQGMIFAGIDGFPTMFEAVRSGLTEATMAQQPYRMGEIAVQNAIGIIEGNGGELPPEQYQDAVLINKETVAQHRPEAFYGPATTTSAN